jgi:hypothetical protein
MRVARRRIDVSDGVMAPTFSAISAIDGAHSHRSSRQGWRAGQVPASVPRPHRDARAAVQAEPPSRPAACPLLRGAAGTDSHGRMDPPNIGLRGNG